MVSRARPLWSNPPEDTKWPGCPGWEQSSATSLPSPLQLLFPQAPLPSPTDQSGQGIQRPSTPRLCQSQQRWRLEGALLGCSLLSLPAVAPGVVWGGPTAAPLSLQMLHRQGRAVDLRRRGCPLSLCLSPAPAPFLGHLPRGSLTCHTHQARSFLLSFSGPLFWRTIVFWGQSLFFIWGCELLFGL